MQTVVHHVKKLAIMSFILAIANGLTACGQTKADAAYKSDSQVAMDNMSKEIDVSKDADAIIDSVKQ